MARIDGYILPARVPRSPLGPGVVAAMGDISGNTKALLGVGVVAYALYALFYKKKG